MIDGKGHNLKNSFLLQLRVIKALLLRETLTRYGRHNIGFLWLFVEPMLFTLGVMVLWSFAKVNSHAEISIAAFAITGYSSVLLWRNMSSRCVKAIEPNLSLLYHRNVKVIDVFLARCLLEIIGATSSFILLSLIFIFLELVPFPDDLLTVCMAWFLLVLFSVALSLIVGALSERSEIIERVWHVMTYLLFPLSGAVFMVDWLPENFQKIILWFPMVHGTEMLRRGYYGSTIITYENPVFLALCSIFMLGIGLALTRLAEKRVEPE